MMSGKITSDVGSNDSRLMELIIAQETNRVKLITRLESGNLGLSLWYILDTGTSLANGVWFNATQNTGIFSSVAAACF